MGTNSSSTDKRAGKPAPPTNVSTRRKERPPRPLHLAKFKDRLSDAEFGKNPPTCQTNSPKGRNCRVKFQKRGQLFIRVHNETLSIIAMHVCNEDSPGCGDYQRVG